jgi:hypothetical protein
MEPVLMFRPQRSQRRPIHNSAHAHHSPDICRSPLSPYRCKPLLKHAVVSQLHSALVRRDRPAILHVLSILCRRHLAHICHMRLLAFSHRDRNHIPRMLVWEAASLVMTKKNNTHFKSDQFWISGLLFL